MADRDWRVLHRKWLEDPLDQDALQAAIRAARRVASREAGVGSMYDQWVHPERELSSELPLDVMILGCPGEPYDAGALNDTSGQLAHPWLTRIGCGSTPGTVALPPRRLWMVRPGLRSPPFPELLAEVRAQRIGGLDLGNTKVEPQSLLDLRDCQDLQLLSFQRSNRVTDATLDDLPLGLRYLDLWACPNVSHAGVERLIRYPELTHLSLRGIPLRPDKIEVLARLGQLTHLNLGRISLTDAHLETVARLSDLSNLDLSGCERLTPRAVEHLARLPNLAFLDLSGCHRLAGAAQALAQLPRLKRLGLRGTQLTHEDRQLLVSRLERLET